MSSSVSCGVSTAVGSSKTSTFASRDRALMISTRCCTPTGRSSTLASGSMSKPKRAEISRTFARAASRSSRPAARGLLVAEHDVLGHREDGDEHEVLVHHADAGVHRVAGAGEGLHLVVEQDLALVGLVQAVEDVHQRGLARTVLAEQGVDLAGLHDEVDVVVGDQGAEALGDATKLEFHAPRLPAPRVGRRCASGGVPGSAGRSRATAACPAANGTGARATAI